MDVIDILKVQLKEMSIKKFKDFINSINNGNDTGESKAEVGFKILFSEENYQLIIKIIGARNLPSSFGNIKTQGYVVKVNKILNS